MPIRPSFIATRRHGVDHYKFSHSTRPYTILPSGNGHYAATVNGFLSWRYPTRSECFAAILRDASFSL